MGSTKHLTEISISNLHRLKGRPALKAKNITTIYEPTVQNMCELLRLTTLWASTEYYALDYIANVIELNQSLEVRIFLVK
jgi:hypothetical protein